ncbi:DUF2809 domain-containing protein [Scleromatobacter humisilvae]|uniref:DUF2809 domain-containing protein n=1 Tax=Scleromatobacter humisilvae TaxID=2897159 RepID=A0A9X1YIK9_9BURK|nr:DUF2809 domain-containing protein [Scleromatobacter humisilvae]MCK9686999.1 DUF2809 domain-containing protein [Scleromatobacter humisilvae]
MSAAADASRRRLAALAAMLATIALGLASRHWPDALPSALGKYPGDALWALMVLFGWRALRPRARTRDVALLAMATSVAVEVAKLWQAPWIVEFRHTAVGHLLLGQVFSWQNLVAYGVGVLAGIVLDRLLLRIAAA